MRFRQAYPEEVFDAVNFQKYEKDRDSRVRLEKNWKIYQTCDTPVVSYPLYGPPTLVGCRKCDKCLKIRQAQWARRAAIEYELAKKLTVEAGHRPILSTWWATMTWRPNDVADPTYRTVQDMFKRLRAKGRKFRYLVSEERGETNGRKHWHALIHCHNRIKKRDLEGDWRAGHLHVRLARGAGLASYMAKYASKDTGRVRASSGYGGYRSLLAILDPARASGIEEYVRTGTRTHACDHAIRLTKQGVVIPLETALGQTIPWDAVLPRSPEAIGLSDGSALNGLPSHTPAAPPF